MRTILLISLFVFILGWKSAGWTKDSFESNDLYIEKARQTAEKRYYERTNSNEQDVIVYPFAIYKQVVNGINYKIFFAAKNIKTNSVQFFEYVVYTGPFGKIANKVFDFKVTSEKEIDFEKDELKLNTRRATKIDQAVSNYSQNSLRIESIKVYNNATTEINFYVVKTNNSKILVVMQEENYTFTVVSEI